MNRWLSTLLLLVVPALACSTSGDSLTGSLSQLYDLSFNSITITMLGSSVSIKYVGSNGDPAMLVVETANIADVANSSIDLTQLVSGQPRGVIQNVGTVTTDLPIEIGTVVFDNVPKVGSSLSGHFAATFSNPSGYTLNGDFSGTVYAP